MEVEIAPVSAKFHAKKNPGPLSGTVLFMLDNHTTFRINIERINSIFK